MFNRTTDFRKESNPLQNSFVKFNYQNLKPMRETLFVRNPKKNISSIIIMVIFCTFLFSCKKNDLEKDSSILARLLCKEDKDPGNDKLVTAIDSIESKYKGKDLIQLQELATKKIMNCSQTDEIVNNPEHDQSEVDNTKNKISSNNDFDKLLDEYEEYVDQYIVFYKKAMQGDKTALIEYPKLLQKAEDLQASIEEAEENNNLTIKQAKRMNDITFKMIENVQNLQNLK
ncbi:DUF6591 domain-containing protein [Elizabethkingia anophelis]|uniref:DUF6591 domain-containing protein n=1 Tax=Elizabethkingia anophelis TaxID=1117645 RepID=UPI00291F01D3|nr:MAG: hypothetical protein PQ275_08990 [Elizabethkingia anophelis]